MKELEAMVRRRALERGTLLLVLQEIQASCGCISQSAITLVATEYGIDEAVVRGVLEFYPELRTTPPGKHRLCLCHGESCAAAGSERLEKSLEQRLGARTAAATTNGTLTYERVYCLGNCALGPSASIDGEVAGRLTPEELLRRLREVDSD